MQTKQTKQVNEADATYYNKQKKQQQIKQQIYKTQTNN
jgi:hypothetical protein